MKLIEAMKMLKILGEKAKDLRAKISIHCANLSVEKPTYEDQKAQIKEWLQSHSDILKKILELRTNIQRTNLATKTKIELGGVVVEKTIAEWIHRRRDLAILELEAWGKLTDRNLKESNLQTSKDLPATEIRIVRFFDPKDRDTKMELYRSEPLTIDATLEVVNATTDLVETSS
jgi:hypothetical protein